MSIETYGDYQLLKKLATGGMAQIFLARQQGMEGFEKFLVVKRILPHLAENEDFIKMFLDEARIAARLNHPNIVQIFNLGAQDDSFFIAMEFIHGEDVRRVWKRADLKNKPIPVPLVARIIMDACGGLDYAHKKADSQGKPLNIVHRDISPQNILVTFEGGVKVVDFGIAKAADQATVTKSGVLKGKYSYMSPEQASGQRIDRRSDIFALGVVLYELITGTRLFKRANDIQTLNAVTECQVIPPSEVKPTVPKDLDPIVMKALARLPEDRYQDAIGLQAALENWVLQNKLPSSSVQLAGFMQDIYAERLEQEAEEGRILIEGLDQSKTGEEKEKATPSMKSLRPTASVQALDPRGEDLEATRAQRPPRTGNTSGAISGAVSGAMSKPRALPKPPPPPPPVNPRILDDDHGGATITTTESNRSGKSIALGGLGLLLAVGLAVVAWQVIRKPVRAEVRIDTDPQGATVRFDGKALAGCSTPCQLPPVPAGSYSLLLSHSGFEDSRTRIEIPESGKIDLPAFQLQPERRAAIEPTRPDAAVPAGPPVFTFKSIPPGALLTLNGVSLGPTPVSSPLSPGARAEVALRLGGFKDFNNSFQAPDHAQELVFTLEKIAAPPPHVTVAPPPAPKKETGTVRFIVKPWAKVQCGTFKLGDTPFPDAQLPVGTYDCTFSNPEYPEKKQAVVVKANETVRVAVNF